MKKEVIIAIIIGVLLGLVITFGIKTAQNSLNPSLANPQPTLPPSATANAALTHTLFIASPQPNAIVGTDQVSVTGSTTPHSLIAVTAADNYNTALADAQGNFSLPINLSDGINRLQVESYTDTGDRASTNFLVVFTTADLNQSPTPTPSPTPEK